MALRSALMHSPLDDPLRQIHKAHSSDLTALSRRVDASSVRLDALQQVVAANMVAIDALMARIADLERLGETDGL